MQALRYAARRSHAEGLVAWARGNLAGVVSAHWPLVAVAILAITVGLLVPVPAAVAIPATRAERTKAKQAAGDGRPRPPAATASVPPAASPMPVASAATMPVATSVPVLGTRWRRDESGSESKCKE